MKNICFTGLMLLLFVIADCTTSKLFAADPPVNMNSDVKPWYKFREDGRPGREIILSFSDGQLLGKVNIEMDCEGKFEQKEINFSDPVNELSILLPDGAGVRNICQARIKVQNGQKEWQESVIVPVKRQWDVYIYPHSHVDIGYTAHQDTVKLLHVRNIDVGIEMAEKTQNYPDGARFIWNPEALWVVDSYLKNATPEKKEKFIEAVKKGWICLDGNYLNTNTSTNSDEELLRLFHYSNHMEKMTGVPIETMVQFDIPGASWGVGQAAVQNGIQSFLLFPNHVGRIGTTREYWEQKPFYWVAPDDSTQILFLQSYPYGYGYNIKGCKIGANIIQTYTDEYDRITTEDPMVNFIDPFIFDEIDRLEKNNHPYEMYIMSWALCDNSLIDADLPDAVKTWNETYAYPKLIIAGAKEIANSFESKYHDIIPKVKGDYTEYWTDGLGSDAKRVGWNRLAKERLVQAEALNVMLNNEHAVALKETEDSWNWIMLGTEHTWGYHTPEHPRARRIEATKASYFEKADKTSRHILQSVLEPVSQKGSTDFAVMNTLSWNRSEVVTIPSAQSRVGNRVVNENGEAVPSQRLTTGELAFLATDIPAFGSKVYKVVAGKSEGTTGCTVQSTKLENDKIKVTIDPKTGDITSLFNKQTKHEYVDQSSEYSLNSYRYLLGADSADKAFAPTNVKIKIKENGPLVASILIESDAEGCNWLKREVKLIAGQSWIDMSNAIDKISTRTKEGIHFGFAFDVPGATTRMDIPWGVMTPEYDQIPGSNRNWLAFQRWIDVSNSNHGVTWTSIYSPLVEFGDLTANILGSAMDVKQWMNRIENTQTLFSWALNNHWFTNFPLEQGGIIKFQYQLLTHDGYDPVVANRFGLERNRPLIIIPVDKNPITKPIVKISNSTVAVSMLKKSDDGEAIVLRLRSISDKNEIVQLEWPNKKPQRIRKCNAEENPGVQVSENEITVKPYGTESIYVEF